MEKISTEIIFILDKSGSMGGLEKDTIRGFNSMLAKQKELEGKCLITTVLFNHHYELLHDRLDVRKVRPMTDKEYQVGGTTALLDAIGMTVHNMMSIQKHTNMYLRAEKVMFVIMTDGEENSSQEYTVDMVRRLIEKQKVEFNWEFLFLGANLDAIEVAESFGINSNRAADYLADSEGTELNFSVISDAVATFRDEGVVKESILDDIREDINRRGDR